MKCILLIDDDQDIRESLAELFEDRYHVLVGANGVEALKILAREHVDAVVLDLMMPRMDGETFFKKLQERAPTLPVVILSAACDLQRLAQSLGAKGCCSKPCSVEQMQAEIGRVMGDAFDGSERSGADASLQVPSTPLSPSTKATTPTKSPVVKGERAANRRRRGR